MRLDTLHYLGEERKWGQVLKYNFLITPPSSGGRGEAVSELTWQERWLIQGVEWAGVEGVATSAMIRLVHAEYL